MSSTSCDRLDSTQALDSQWIPGQTLTLPTYELEQGDYVHYVKLCVAGVPTEFLVDSGCIYSEVMPKEVRSWGLLEPGATEVHVSVDSLRGEVVRFLITDGLCDNLLGLDILYRFSCTLDFHSHTLSFSAPRKIPKRPAKIARVRVAGRELRAVIDTGAAGFVTAHLDVARGLGMTLTDVSHLGIRIERPTETYVMKYSSRTSLTAYGVSEVGDVIVLNEVLSPRSPYDILVGCQFIVPGSVTFEPKAKEPVVKLPPRDVVQRLIEKGFYSCRKKLLAPDWKG